MGRREERDSEKRMIEGVRKEDEAWRNEEEGRDWVEGKDEGERKGNGA